MSGAAIATVRKPVTKTNGDRHSLFDDGVLIDLEISYWRGGKALCPQDINLSPEELPAIFSLGRKLLVPKSTIKTFRNLENKSRYALDNMSFSFPLGGGNFVPYSSLPLVVRALDDIESQFAKASTNFLNNYDKYRAEIIATYSDHQEALERGVPDAEALARRFKYHYSLYEVALPRKLKVRAMTRQKAIRVASARLKVLEQAETTAKAKLETQLDGFLNTAALKLRDGVTQVVKKIQEKITNGEIVTKTTTDSLRRAIEQFRSLNFMGDNEVEDELARLERTIPDSAEEYRKEEVAREFDSALVQTMAAINVSDLTKVTGEYRRKIRY